jgi:hypothetical protein
MLFSIIIILTLTWCFLIGNITAFVGTIDEDLSALPITGNGKTVSMTGYALLDYKRGKTVWSNYKTDFSEFTGFQEMITRVKENARNNCIEEGLVLAVTEMRKLLDAVGSEKDQLLYVDDFVEQIRKLKCTLYYDTQRFNSIHKRLRIHTNVVLIPYKTHMDDNPCYSPSCMKPHKIYIYSHKPENPIDKNGNMIPRKCFNASVVGKHFNTEEFCEDKLFLPKKEKGEK